MNVPFRPSFPLPFFGSVVRFCAFAVPSALIHRSAFQRRRSRAMADWLESFPFDDPAQDERYSTTEEYRVFSEQLRGQDEAHARASLSKCETLALAVVRVPSRLTIPARTDPRATVPMIPTPRKTKLWQYLESEKA